MTPEGPLPLAQVADCYSEPHLFVEVSDLQPWRIIRINQSAVRVTGERPFVVGDFLGLDAGSMV